VVVITQMMTQFLCPFDTVSINKLDMLIRIDLELRVASGKCQYFTVTFKTSYHQAPAKLQMGLYTSVIRAKSKPLFCLSGNYVVNCNVLA